MKRCRNKHYYDGVSNTDLGSLQMEQLSTESSVGNIGNLATGISNAVSSFGSGINLLSGNAYTAIYGDSSQDPLARMFNDFTGRSTKKAIANIQNNTNIETANSFDDILKLQLAYTPMSLIKSKSSLGDMLTDNILAFGKGASYGAAAGPWGALFGGIAGGVANIFSRFGLSKRRAEVNKAIKERNLLVERNIENQALNLQNSLMDDLLSNYTGVNAANGGSIHIAPSKRGTFTAAASKHNMGVQEFANKVLSNKENYSPAMVKKANFARNASKWHHAFGGDLLTHGANFDDGFTYIGNGGTHELNPNEGVLMGIAPDGKPNLVEEGEVVWNDYVFSDRLKHPKTGKSFAKEALKASKESEERPNDPISRNGKEDALFKLEELLERIRQEKNMTNKGHLHAFGEWLKKNWTDEKSANAMRATSVIPSLIGLINPSKAYSITPSNIRDIDYNPLGLKLTYNPYDINYIANQLGASAAANRRAIQNTSGGNRGAVLAGLLSQGYNELLGLGLAYRLAMEYNDAQREKVATFNRATDLANALMALEAARANQSADAQRALMQMTADQYNNAQLDAVYSNRMGNWLNLFGNISKMGEDYLNRKDASKAWKAFLEKMNNKEANGGRINKRRRGLTY